MFLSIDDYIADLQMQDAERYLDETYGSAISQGGFEMEATASVSMDKIVVINRDLGNGKGLVYECRYNELAAELAPIDYVAARFDVGQEARRVKQLQNMGYKVRITERTGDAPWDKVFADCVRPAI